jgi:hypothetical protein
MKNTERNNAKFKVVPQWMSSTLERLEKDVWGEPEYGSHLVTTCHALRKKELRLFQTEDIRIMIGQNIGLPYLLPLAFEVLKSDILATGDYFSGDLLLNVLKSDPAYWKKHPAQWRQVCDLFAENRQRLETQETTKHIKNGWFEAFERFELLGK